MEEYIKKRSFYYDHILENIYKKGGELNIPIIKFETALYLISYLQIKKVGKILEIGSGLGCSTYIFSKYSSEKSKITSVDLSLPTIKRVKNILSSIKEIEKIDWVHCDGVEFLKNSDLNYDLYFIDAKKGDYPDYFNAIIDKVDRGDIIFDNIFLNKDTIERETYKGKSINKLVFDLFRSKYGKFSLLPIGDGVGVFTINKIRGDI